VSRRESPLGAMSVSTFNSPGLRLWVCGVFAFYHWTSILGGLQSAGSQSIEVAWTLVSSMGEASGLLCRPGWQCYLDFTGTYCLDAIGRHRPPCLLYIEFGAESKEFGAESQPPQ
jgi:hypothetical protein